MPKYQKIVTVVGGTGFLGRYVVRELAQAGYTVRVISRHPEQALHLKTAGTVGQVVLQKGDITRPETIEGKFGGSHAVINLVGVLFERGRQNFDNVHIQGAKKVAKEAWKCGAKYFVQVSAIGASNGSKAKYGRSKSMGEKAICDAFKGATIIRPSVLFGPEDDFFNKFAKLASWLPFLPLIGKGNTRFQPVYVADVARAIVATIDAPALAGKTYELGGPEVMTYKDILRYILKQTGRQRPFFSAPPAFWKLKAWFWELMPTPILTRDQIRMLAYDNVVDENTPGFAALGITPISLQMVVPGYLARYRKSQHIAVDAGDESPA